MDSSNESPSRTQDVLACLAVPSRYRLVKAIAESDSCVGELAISVGLSQSCTTRHLQALERAGLVKGKRDGRRVRFALCADAWESGSILALVLSAERSPAPSGRTAASSGATPVAALKAGASGEPGGKPLPKIAIMANPGDSVKSRGVTSPEPPRAPSEDDISGRRPSLSSFRRQDIEDYLL